MKTIPIHTRASVIACVLSGSLLALSACTSTAPDAAPASAAAATPSPRPGAARITNEFVATARVLVVDAAERLVTLQREDGTYFKVRAGEEVRNFAQIAPGDSLRVRFAETLQVSLLPDGEISMATEGAVVAGRAEAGAKPAGGVGAAVSLRVRIESIDAPRDIVVFSLESGELVTHRIATPEGRKFVSGLKVGDRVQIDYAETLALSIEKT